jgi:hypothetical protein
MNTPSDSITAVEVVCCRKGRGESKVYADGEEWDERTVKELKF